MEELDLAEMTRKQQSQRKSGLIHCSQIISPLPRNCVSSDLGAVQVVAAVSCRWLSLGQL
jgi:hypothetical protein